MQTHIRGGGKEPVGPKEGFLGGKGEIEKNAFMGGVNGGGGLYYYSETRCSAQT